MLGNIYPDSIFYNGRILLMDAAFTIAGALAVRDGRILAAGTDEEIVPLAGPETEMIDLQGFTVLPGINDVHIHLAIGGCTLLGRDAGEDLLAVPELAADEEIRRSYERMFRFLTEHGVTSVTDGELGPRYDTERRGLAGCRSISVLNDMKNAGELPVRVGIMFSAGHHRKALRMSWLEEYIPKMCFHTGFGDEWLRITGLKLFADGAPGMGNAFTRDPYPDGHRSGMITDGDTPEEQQQALIEMVRYAHRYGFRVGIHCTGDLAIDTVADAYIRAQEDIPGDTRDYIIHGDQITQECIEKISGRGIGYSAFLPAMWRLGEEQRRIVGEERCSRVYPLRSLTDAGVCCTAHTDFPFSNADWRLAVQVAVTRQSEDGAGVCAPDEALDIKEALRLFTSNAAWQTGEEDIKGTLEPGKLADMCVLGEDILTADPYRISEIPVMMTVLGGRVIMDRRKN